MIPIEDYELGRRIVENCTCECGSALTLPWGGSYGIDSYVIRCAADPTHDRVKVVKSLYAMWKNGEEIPSFIKDKIEWKYRRRIMQEENIKAMVVKQDRAKLAVYVQAQFPTDLNRDTAVTFAAFCIAHQLEPIRDCVPYHGKPYICIAWGDRKAAGDSAFKGYTYKVYGKKEKEALDFDPRDLVAECLANFDGLDSPLVGLGVIRIKEREALSKGGAEPDDVTGTGYRAPVVHTHPQEMLFKRARAAVHRQRYHPPAPILEELPYTTAVETTYRVLPEITTPTTTPPSKDFPVGGEKTGERTGNDKLTETGHAKAPTTDQATKLPPAPTVFSPTKGKEGEAKIPPSVPAADLPRNPIFQNWGELAAAAYKLGVTPDQVFKHQHVKRWEDFASYLDAWHVVEFLVTERAEKPPLL
jgi:hypothetical protein